MGQNRLTQGMFGGEFMPGSNLFGLSGGQMRRVVIAGLLARWPKALILDEPLAGLDAASQRGLLRLLTDLRRNTGLTVIVISHDFAGLEELCPRTLHLERGTIASTSAQAGGVL